MQKGKQSLCFTEAPFIISTANIVGKKEGEGPLAGLFDVIGEDDKFGQNTWEEAESTMQKEACRNFAESQGWEIVKEFSEKGVSGFKKSAKERDELQKIQQAAMEGKFDILLVFMFDRLGRRDDETPFIVEWFTKQGIEVWSVNEGQQRFDTHVDKLMNYIRYWQASGESLKTSVRTRTRLEQLTGEGHYTGGTVPYGKPC